MSFSRAAVALMPIPFRTAGILPESLAAFWFFSDL